MEEPRYTLVEAHRLFARQIHGRVWELLDKAKRNAAEDEEILCAAYASLYHWLHAGTAVNRQRGHWLVSRVRAELGHGEEALRHALHCLELTEQHRGQMEDFDIAFAFECVARANAVLGTVTLAKKYLLKAEEAGQNIGASEDRKIFFDSLHGGNWHRVCGKAANSKNPEERIKT